MKFTILIVEYHVTVFLVILLTKRDLASRKLMVQKLLGAKTLLLNITSY